MLNLSPRGRFKTLQASPRVRDKHSVQVFKLQAYLRTVSAVHHICANVLLSGAERRKRTLWPLLLRIS